MRMAKLFIVGFILLTASVSLAQSARLKGKVQDTSGLIMPGATIKVYQGNKVIKETTSTATGDFDVPVAPGDYKLEVSAPDFETHTEEVKVTPALAPLTVTMSLAVITTNVDVTDNVVAVSVDTDSSLSATTLNGDSITELPDDETELANYLTQIAGSRGGADTGGGAGGFVIDGFNSGNLPPKDQIQEIRINNNPYSTEFSGIGFGRVEIITRAGTGNFNGNMQFNFRDATLDATNPMTHSKAPYQTKNFNWNYGGPFIKNKLTMNFRANSNDNENSGGINARLADGTLLTQPWVNPNINRGFNTRGQYALTRNNTLNFNYSYNSNTQKNAGLNEFTLPEYASDAKRTNSEIQIRETSLLTPKLVLELRFEIQHNTSATTPRTNALSVRVLDSFTSGGGQNRATTDNRNYEFGNLLMYSSAKWTSKAGMQIVSYRNHSESYSNYFGTYQFSSLAAYVAGAPTIFTQSYGNPLLDDRQVELGSFWQNDWKFSKRFSFNAGVRYEAQTNLDSHRNIDPRIGFALGLTKTIVLRGGAGLFHQRLNLNNVETLLRNDGTKQLSITIPNPVFNPVGPPTGSAQSDPNIRVRAAELIAPRNGNTSLSLEKGWSHGLGTTFSWDMTRGIHLFRSRNINAPYPGTPLSEALLAQLNSRDPLVRSAALVQVNSLRPLYPYSANIYQLESTGKLRSNNLNIGFRENLPKIWSLQVFGSYGLGSNKSDTDGAFSTPVNSYSLKDEWARSFLDTRHRFNAGVNFRIPTHSTLTGSANSFVSNVGKLWDVSAGNTFMLIFINANSNRPYNITTGTDLNGDTSTNDRPAGVPRNSGIGPSSYNVNLNFNKQFNLRREKRAGNATRAANPYTGSFAEPQRGGGPGGGFPGGGDRGPGGPPGGILGGQKGPGGPGGPGGMRPGVGPTVTFSANVNNLLNNTQYRTYSGVLTSSFYGMPTAAVNPRSVNLGMRFNF